MQVSYTCKHLTTCYIYIYYQFQQERRTTLHLHQQQNAKKRKIFHPKGKTEKFFDEKKIDRLFNFLLI